MRKLKIIEHISLDGVIQHSANDGDFPYSDWTAPYRAPAGREAIMVAQGGRFDLLLGRCTYDIWSGFWPKAPSGPMADGLNAATKYVATHRQESLDWVRSRSLDRTSSKAFAASSCRTARTLSSGAAPRSHRRCFNMGLRMKLCWPSIRSCWARESAAQGTPSRSFELVSTQAMPSGIILSTYKVVGPLKTG